MGWYSRRCGDAVGDTIDGIKALGDWETWKGMATLSPI